MKTKLLIFAGAFLVLALVLRSVEKPVLAQIRAALIQNVDEPGRNVFGLFKQNNDFGVNFAVPAGERYVIEQYTVQCNVSNTSSMTNILLTGSTNGALVLASAMPHFVSPNGSGVNLWMGTGTGHFYADGGTSFNLYPQTNSSGAASGCIYSVSGYVIHNP